jgi:hypothetical protein
MPDDLDDFEIHPPRQYEPELGSIEPPQRRLPPRRSALPMLLAAAFVVAVGVIGLLWRKPWKTKAPAPVAQATPLPSPSPVPPAETRGPLPGLDDSDGFVRDLAAALSAHPELARWLGQTGLVRTLTAVVANIASGETPRPELSFLAPAQRFKAAGRAGRVVADPASYSGYDLFADGIASIDAEAAAGVYDATEPLFDTAHRELGYPAAFRPALDRAIRELLAVPVPRPDAELVPHASGFRWADPKLEALTSAQKQLLRTGPRNVRMIQAKLRELQAALAG